jgi:hypothetical protein
MWRNRPWTHWAVGPVPGFPSKLIAFALAPLPRSAWVPIMGRVMYRMTEHHQQS